MLFRVLVIAIALPAWASAVSAGTVRYDFPELLGDRRFDGSLVGYSPVAYVDTPFTFYSVTEARLVVEGTVSTGRARGDGVIRENVEFDLLPSVTVQPSFSHTATIQTQPTPESFRLEQIYPNPFAPETTPLPNPDGYPSISFSVRVYVGLPLINNFPPLIVPPEPGELVLATDGIVVDVPIIAQITDAYIVLSGPGVVPEPSSFAIAVVLPALLIAWSRQIGRCGLRWRCVPV
jgi:hypothetical protein